MSTIDDNILTDAGFINEIRPQMLKFAMQQLRDEQLAEDVVQDALLGALKNQTSFNRQAALKTWVFAILKNKIADALRKKVRDSDRHYATEDEQGVEAAFDSQGHWQKDHMPHAWGEPGAGVITEQFWRVFDSCLNDLPPQQGRLFMMREFIGLETAEICDALDISVSNLHVMLYRARMRLRDCLESHWFLEGENR